MTSYHTKKRLGQHFLNAPEIVTRIVTLANPTPTDTVVEVGPGQGILTVLLAESGAQIIAVEFDRDLAPMLRNKFSASPRVEIINQDFLKFEPTSIEAPHFVLIGNLPYNITSPVMEWVVKYRSRITRAVFMVQKEMALRISARPGTKDWSPLSIFTQLAFEVKLAFDVPPQCFAPPPAVMSSVIELVPNNRPQPEYSSEFEGIVRSSFAQRRKVLANNLVPLVVPTETAMKSLLSELGFRPDLRAEQIAIEEFEAITRYCIDHGFTQHT